MVIFTEKMVDKTIDRISEIWEERSSDQKDVIELLRAEVAALRKELELSHSRERTIMNRLLQEANMSPVKYEQPMAENSVSKELLVGIESIGNDMEVNENEG